MELPIDEFIGYIVDICSQTNENDLEGAIGSPKFNQKLKVVLERLADTSVRVASSKLLNKDIDIKSMSNEELADAMQKHVTFRSSGKTESKLPNSAWSMLLEAAVRLKALKSE